MFGLTESLFEVNFEQSVALLCPNSAMETAISYSNYCYFVLTFQVIHETDFSIAEYIEDYILRIPWKLVTAGEIAKKIH